MWPRMEVNGHATRRRAAPRGRSNTSSSMKAGASSIQKPGQIKSDFGKTGVWCGGSRHMLIVGCAERLTQYSSPSHNTGVPPGSTNATNSAEIGLLSTGAKKRHAPTRTRGVANDALVMERIRCSESVFPAAGVRAESGSESQIGNSFAAPSLRSRPAQR